MENIEKMVQEALDSTKSAHKRIDRMEKRQDNLEELTNAFSVASVTQWRERLYRMNGIAGAEFWSSTTMC